MRIRVIRSARKHRIGNAHIVAAIEQAGEPELRQPSRSDRLPYLWWVGIDDRGIELEIGGFFGERDGVLVVFHAMPTEFRQRSQAEES